MSPKNSCGTERNITFDVRLLCWMKRTDKSKWHIQSVVVLVVLVVFGFSVSACHRPYCVYISVRCALTERAKYRQIRGEKKKEIA